MRALLNKLTSGIRPTGPDLKKWNDYGLKGYGQLICDSNI